VLVLLNILYARENPFFPAKGEVNMPYTSNKDRSLPPLKKATITLPSQARIIKKVTLEYKCLDGSIEKKSIELQNSVDWHLPIVISQNYSIDLKQQDKNLISSNKTKKSFKKLASFKYGVFFASKTTLKIVTKDKIIRNFMLVDPHRIVIDFSRDTNLKTYTKINKNSVFKKIRIGNHSKYYRVVIELDGQYRFTKQKIPDGYIFVLH
jgi:hypothetical protein